MTTKLKLNYPVNDGSVVITELEFQPLKAKHIRRLPSDDKDAANFLLNLAGELSGHSPRVIDELSAEDTFRVLEVLKGFFPNSNQTLKTG